MGQSQGPESGFVQVATDGSGKRVLNLPIAMMLVDGTIQTVYAQAVVAVDEQGTPINQDHSVFQHQVIRELRAIVRGLEVLTEHKLYD